MNRERLGCPEFRRLLRAERVSRRGFLQAGMLGTVGAGLSLSGLLRSEAQAADAGKSPGRTKSVIILWMRGGPAQHETWDPKPDAPVEYRGEFSPIRTNVPGILINEYLPMSARIMNKWSIIRSMHHTDLRASHSTGDQICFTGYSNEISPATNIHPSCGAIAMKQLQHL